MLGKKEETGIMRIRTSRKYYLPFYIMVFILLSVVIYIKIEGYPINKISFYSAIIFCVLVLKFTEFHRYNSLYEINQDSLVHVQGILTPSKAVRRIDFFAISYIAFDQNWWQRIFRFGNVNVRLFARDSTTMVKNIDKPEKFSKFLEHSINEKRRITKTSSAMGREV
ncbi:MAG: PH domain-containing protein [archaeon]